MTLQHILYRKLIDVPKYSLIMYGVMALYWS